MKLVLNIILAATIAISFAAAHPEAAAKHQKKKAAAAHSMTGCLQKGTEANTFELTNVAGNGPKTVELLGAPAGTDLSAHVGHKVTITGTSVNARAAAKAEGTTGKKDKKEMKEERGEHHMQVTGLKMVAPSCS